MRVDSAIRTVGTGPVRPLYAPWGDQVTLLCFIQLRSHVQGLTGGERVPDPVPPGAGPGAGPARIAVPHKRIGCGGLGQGFWEGELPASACVSLRLLIGRLSRFEAPPLAWVVTAAPRRIAHTPARAPPRRPTCAAPPRSCPEPLHARTRPQHLPAMVWRM